MRRLLAAGITMALLWHSYVAADPELLDVLNLHADMLAPAEALAEEAAPPEDRPPRWSNSAIILMPGDRVAEPGIFLPAPDAMTAAEMLNHYQGLLDRVAALESQVASQLEQIAALQASLGSSERELALKDLIVQHKDEMLAFRKDINEEYKTLLVESRQTLQQNQTTITRLEKRIEALENRGFWTTILALVLGLVTGGLGSALLR
jgi:hypothetical protein